MYYRVRERRDSHASSCHELSLEHTRSVDLGKHSVCTHFPKNRNCEICQMTKITRAPCRRLFGGVVPRAENFGDLITADHKVLSEGCESRNNHRCAVVVQDLATQWIQSYPCKTKTSQETQRSLQKFLEPNRKPKVIYTDNSSEFGKVCEDLSWSHCTSTPHRSETNGIAERSRAQSKGRDICGIVVIRSAICETFKISCLMGRHPMRGGSERWSNITSFLRKTNQESINLEKKSLTWTVPWIRIERGGNLERSHSSCRH